MLLRRFRAGQVEVAVIAVGDGLPDYDLVGPRAEQVPAGSGLGVAVANSHPFATRDEVDVRDLAGQVSIVGSGREGDPQFGGWPTLAEPRIGHEAHTRQTRPGLVAAGLGMALVPGMSADLVPCGVTEIPVRDPGLVERRRTVVITGENPSATATAFVQTLTSS